MRRNSTLATLIMFTSAAEILCWSYQVLLPSLARDVLDVGAEGLGVMNASRSVGAILGTIGISIFGDFRGMGVVYLSALTFFGGFVIALAFVGNFYLALVVLVLITSMAVITDILSQGLMQLMVPDRLRGRAMGSWILAIGTGPVGHLEVGALASAVGTTIALTVNGVGLSALAILTGIFSKRLRSL
jgi:hypothetical protein